MITRDPNLRRTRSRSVPVCLCAVSLWRRRNKGKAQL